MPFPLNFEEWGRPLPRPTKRMRAVSSFCFFLLAIEVADFVDCLDSSALGSLQTLRRSLHNQCGGVAGGSHSRAACDRQRRGDAPPLIPRSRDVALRSLAD